MRSVAAQSSGNSRELEGQGGRGLTCDVDGLDNQALLRKGRIPHRRLRRLALRESHPAHTSIAKVIGCEGSRSRSNDRACDLQRPGRLALVLARPNRHGRHMAHRLEAVNQLLWALEPAGEPAHVHGAAPAMVHSRREKRLACGRESRVNDSLLTCDYHVMYKQKCSPQIGTTEQRSQTLARAEGAEGAEGSGADGERVAVGCLTWRQSSRPPRASSSCRSWSSSRPSWSASPGPRTPPRWRRQTPRS